MSFVPNLGASIVDSLGKIIPPWNSFFQQFTSNAEAASEPKSPFQPNTQGNLIFTGVPPAVTLTRGRLSISISGTRIIPLAIGDSAVWPGAPTVYFFRTFSK